MQSVYISNIHAGNLGLRFALTKRADLYVGYNITKDTGDGRSALAAQPTAIAQVFYNVQTFPLTYQTPLVRVSIRLTQKLRYNLGYQYYGSVASSYARANVLTGDTATNVGGLVGQMDRGRAGPRPVSPGD